MTVRYEALGFDPAPGEVDNGQAMARTLREVTRALAEIDQVVHGRGDQEWRGRAAEAYQDLMAEEFAPRIREAYQSFSVAARALDLWVGDLASFQARAAALEQEADAARQGIAAVWSSLDGLGAAPPDPEQAVEHRSRRADLESALRSRQNELDGILTRARALAEEASRSASSTAGALDTAMRAAPDAPGLFDLLSDIVADVGEFLGDVIEFVKDNWWDILHKLVAVAVVVLAVAALLVPGVGWLATAAVIAAIADTAMSGVDWLVLGRDGAKEAFLTGLVGLGAGAALGAVVRASAPGMNAALSQGPFQLAIQGARPASVATPTTAAIAVNSLYAPALGGYLLLRWKDSRDVTESVRSMLGGSTYYDDDLAQGWAEARSS